MIEIRYSDERGATDHGWLHSRHSFSFGDYYDRQHMGVSALRVINDDKVEPGAGFATHSHQDMEIISYVKKGTIEHKDSMGNIEQLPAGEFQLMSAGSGVTHSEYNPSDSESLEFLQIWIQPNAYGIPPEYQQKRFAPQEGLQLIISPDGHDDSLRVHQDASLYQALLSTGQSVVHDIKPGRSVYLHTVSGSLKVNGETLSEGDGITLKQVPAVEIHAVLDSEALLFDLPEAP
jgi:hypothetical protein